MPKSASGALLSTVEIDKTLKTPLYKQLENFLRSQILEGILKPTQKLPSSRELAEDLGISSCLLYTSPSPRDCRLSRMPSSA